MSRELFMNTTLHNLNGVGSDPWLPLLFALDLTPKHCVLRFRDPPIAPTPGHMSQHCGRLQNTHLFLALCLVFGLVSLL